MASPVSVGDAILLSTLAYRLGRTLTTERKGVPSALRELQNQLYALGNALNFVGFQKHSGDTDTNRESANAKVSGHRSDGDCSQDRMRAMISNCGGVLKRMEKLVEKYECLTPPLEQTDAASAEKAGWRDGVKCQWKRVRFLLNDENLQGIKRDLAVHVDALNLAISALNRSQGERLAYRVDGVHNMLEDLHSWFTKHLKPHTPSEGPFAEDEKTRMPDVTFELHDWLQEGSSSNNPSLFVCNCPPRRDSQDALNGADASLRSHHKNLKYHIVPVSLIVRLAGSEPGWQIFAASGTRVVSLTIRKVDPSKLAVFQGRIDQLAMIMGQSSLDSGTSSLLVYHAQIASGEKIATVLDSKWDGSSLQGQIDRATFISRGNSFTQRQVDSIHLLHYRSLVSLKPRGKERKALVHQHYAEIILQPASNGSSLSRLIVEVELATNVELANESRILIMSNVSCTAEQKTGASIRITDAVVELAFATPSIAKSFLGGVQSMQRQLRIYYLQFPQLGEQTVFQRPCGDILIDDIFFRDARMTVLFSPWTASHRLILLSSFHATSMSMELPPTFFQSLLDNGGSTTNLILSAVFVEHTTEGTEITEKLTDLSAMLSSRSRLSLIQSDTIRPAVESPIRLDQN